MQKWEYCSWEPSFANHAKSRGWLIRFGLNGQSGDYLDKEVPAVDYDDAYISPLVRDEDDDVARIVAQLGIAGWGLVSVTQLLTEPDREESAAGCEAPRLSLGGPRFYFKRLLGES